MARVIVTLVVLGACRFAPDGLGRDGGDGLDGALVDGALDAPIDAAIDARACPAAPMGCTAFTCAGSASCYYACAPTSWQAANTRCSTAGIGCLATIDSAAENQCITDATSPSFPGLVWFGWRQSAAGPEPAGGWGWECDSSTFVAGNWGQFEPNDEGGHEDCGALGTGGAWIDGTCSTSLRYVCELP